MSKKGYVPTSQELDEMFLKAEAGDLSALDWIYQQNATLAKRANSRMKYLEDQDMNTAAYTRAQYWLGEETGKSRFSKGKNEDLDALREQMDMESQFLRWQTSTATGERRRRESIYDSLAKGGYINVPDDPKRERQYKKEMDKILSSDVFSELKTAQGSVTTFKNLSETIERGGKADDLITLFQEMNQLGDYDLFDVWDGWREGKRHLTDG